MAPVPTTVVEHMKPFAVLVFVSQLALIAGRLGAVELPLAFNGNDLEGWLVPADNSWWRVKEGVLSAESNVQKTGSILWTEQEYGNFILEMEFQFVSGTVDSGIFIRDEREQIQIGISGSLKRDMTASPYIAGKGYPVEAKGVEKLLAPQEWNALTVVAKGDRYLVWLNGELVLNYESDTAAPRGPIGLQLHPNTEMKIVFRGIRIAQLD